MTHDGLLVLAYTGPEVCLYDIEHRPPHSVISLGRIASEGPNTRLLPAARVAEGARSRLVLFCHDPQDLMLFDFTGSRIPTRDWRSMAEIRLAGMKLLVLKLDFS